MAEAKILIIFKGNIDGVIDAVKDKGAYFFSRDEETIKVVEMMNDRDDNSDIIDFIEGHAV